MTNMMKIFAMMALGVAAGCAEEGTDEEAVETPYAGCWRYDAYGPNTYPSTTSWTSERVDVTGGYWRITSVRGQGASHQYSMDWKTESNNTNWTEGRMRTTCEKMDGSGNPTSINVFSYNAFHAATWYFKEGAGPCIYPSPCSACTNGNYQVWYSNANNRYWDSSC